MPDDNAIELLQAEIARLIAREGVLRRAIEEKDARISTLYERLSPRERLRIALEECPACGDGAEVDGMSEEQVIEACRSHGVKAS